MNGEHPKDEQVRFLDIAKRGVAIADANVAFIVFYSAVEYLTWLGLTRIETHLLSTGADSSPEISLSQVMPYLVLFWITTSSVQAFMDCVIARLLSKQVLSIESDAGLLLVASLRKFYLRMLLLSAIHVMVFTFALPLYPVAYVALRYVAAFVIWQDCAVRTAFSGLSGFLSVHLTKFLPVWLAGAVLLVGTNLAARSPASTNLVFMGLLHLVVAYFDFAVMATALVSFIMLQGKRQEVLA